MDLALQICSYLVWLPLEVLTMSAMLRAGVSRYPFIFAYLVASFLTTLIEIAPSLAFYTSGRRDKSSIIFWYWFDEGIREVLIFAVVISLIYGASARVRPRRLLRLGLTLGGLLFIGTSFLIHYGPKLPVGVWMTLWTRDLKFCAAILDLALWALLLGSRVKDNRLLLLTGAMGIMFTGEAIGESIRSMAIRNQSHLAGSAGSLLILLADLAFLYIWWQAFRNEAQKRKSAQI
jgi:hypothetical protein